MTTSFVYDITVVATGNKRCYQWDLSTPEIDLAGAEDPAMLVRNRLR